MKKAVSFLFKLSTTIALLINPTSCTHDPDSEPNPNPGYNSGGGSGSGSGSGSSSTSSGYAPKSVAGKEFRFYTRKENDYKFKYSVIAAETPSNAKISFGSQYIIISTPYFKYDKTGKNTAFASCMFYYQLYGIIGYDNIYDYELELTFLSKNHGTYKGQLSHYESTNDWMDVSGVFVYNTTKDPEDFRF